MRTCRDTKERAEEFIKCERRVSHTKYAVTDQDEEPWDIEPGKDGNSLKSASRRLVEISRDFHITAASPLLYLF
jgi:hypothetical protein